MCDGSGRGGRAAGMRRGRKVKLAVWGASSSFSLTRGAGTTGRKSDWFHVPLGDHQKGASQVFFRTGLTLHVIL